jgi:hypothetical protein
MNAKKQIESRSVAVKPFRVVLVGAIGVLCPLRLPAGTFFSNLGQGTNVYGGHNMDNTSYRLATDFLTGSSPTTITNSSLKLTSLDSVGHNFTLSLFTDSGSSLPGLLVGSFDSTFLPAYTPQGIYSFNSPGISLAPKTAYWAVLQMDENVQNTDPYWWELSSQTTDPGSVFSTIPGTPIQLSRDSGTSWTDGTTGNFWFSLSGTVVPEPTTFALLGVGLLCAFSPRRLK